MGNAPKPFTSFVLRRQLGMVLDPIVLRGISDTERSAVVACLARLLMEAAGVETEERVDDGR